MFRMSSYADKAGAMAPELNALVKRYLDEGRTEGIMAEADAAMRKLTAQGLAYLFRPRAQGTGVHPDNRWESGLEPADVYEVIRKIMARGWSDAKVAGARAFEVATGEKGELQRNFNAKLCTGSNGAIPTIQKEDIQILTVSCSHNAASLRCIKFGGVPPCPDGFEDLVDASGALSEAKILEKYPSYANVLRDGLEFVVVRKEVEVVCPRFPLFLQEAGNAEHGGENKLTKLQAMLEIHSKALRDRDMHGAENWNRISKQALPQ